MGKRKGPRGEGKPTEACWVAARSCLGDPSSSSRVALVCAIAIGIGADWGRSGSASAPPPCSQTPPAPATPLGIFYAKVKEPGFPFG